MKRQLNGKEYILCITVLIIFALIGCSKKGENLEQDIKQTSQMPSHEVCIDISSNENLLFNIYDMVVCVDGEEVGTVANGKRLIKYMDLSEGSHILKVYKMGKEKVYHNITFDIVENTTVTCEFKHKKNSIKCLSATTSGGVPDKEVKIGDYRNVLLSEAIDRLNLIGIYDIQQKPNSEIYSEEDWIVVWQSVDPGDIVSRGSTICLDCMDLDYYIKLNSQGNYLNEVYNKFENSGLVVRYLDDNSQDNTQAIEAMTDEQRGEWIVSGLDYQVGKKVTLKIVNPDEKRKLLAEEKARAEEEKLEEERKLAEAEKEKQLEEEKKKEEENRKKEEEKKKEEERKLAEAEKAKEDKNKKESQSDKTSEDNKKTSEEKKSEEVIPQNPYLKIPDYSVSCMTDYAHIDDDCVTLGNNEKAHITITAKASGVTKNDFTFEAEDNSVQYTITDVINDDVRKETIIKLDVNKTSPGLTEFYFCPNYDLYEQGEDALWTVFSIYKLDSKQGKLVYYTPTGEKYHFSKSCAGENAMETTLNDAQAFLDPCGKCAY